MKEMKAAQIRGCNVRYLLTWRLCNEPGVSKVKVGVGDSVVTEVECIADVNDQWWRAAGSGVMWQSSLHVDVVGQNNEGGWQTIKWHIIRRVGTSVDVHMAGQCPKKYAKGVQMWEKWW